MSTKVNKTWHLSASARWILINLRNAIQANLDLDEKGNSCDFTGHYSLFPWIFKAFIRIWCRKIPFCVLKKSYSRVSPYDCPIVIVSKEVYERMRCAYNSELNRERALVLSGSDDLPF